jgi:outer membrane protein
MTISATIKNNTMRIKFLSIFALIAAPLLSAKAQTASIKIGYTNTDYVLSLMPEAKEISAEITSYQKQLETQLQSKYQEFQDKYSDYQQKASSGQMIPEVMKDKETELNALQQSIQKFQKDADESIQKKQAELLQPAYDKIQNAINAVAKDNGYTYVFSSDAGTYPVLLYVRDQDNITDLILLKLGIQPPVKQDSLKRE